MQTIYDTIAFGLIVYKTIREAFGPRTNSNQSLRAIIARHGLLYYACVSLVVQLHVIHEKLTLAVNDVALSSPQILHI